VVTYLVPLSEILSQEFGFWQRMAGVAIRTPLVENVSEFERRKLRDFASTFLGTCQPIGSARLHRE
jgi:hypothetical protein